MKNSTAVFNILTASFIYGAYFFNHAEDQARLVVVGLSYLFLIIIAAAFQIKWLTIASSIICILLIAFLRFTPTFYILICFQIAALNNVFKVPLYAVPAGYLLCLFLIPSAILPLFILTSLLIISFEYIKSRSIDKTEHFIKQTEIIELKNQELNMQLSQQSILLKEAAFLSKLEERNQIAQKLHDELGHTITGSIMQLEAAKTVLSKKETEAAGFLDKTTQALQSGLASIRTVLSDIKPSAAQLGHQQLKEFISAYNADNEYQIETEHLKNIESLSSAMWSVIIDNLKEFLTNSIRHGDASKTVVTFSLLNKIIKIEFRDNGDGCKIIERGMGLNGMEERTSLIEGTLIIDGSDGFSIIMIFKRNQ